MNYKEAKDLLDRNDWLKSFGAYEREGATAYPIEFKIIGIEDKIWDIKNQMDINQMDNERALIHLDLINENLKVLMIAQNNIGQWIIEDMYIYLKITSQLR